MNIYIVRHAKSKETRNMVFAESSLVDLSELGVGQAYALAKKIKKFSIDKIFSSPLLRTRRTSEIISGGIIPIEYRDTLLEHVPSRTLFGAAFKEAKKKTIEDHDFVPENGESFNSAANRFISTLNEIAQLKYDNVCVVSHALIIGSALTKLFNFKLVPSIDEASITLIKFDGNKFDLVYLNKTPFSFRKFIKKIIR